MPFRNQFQNMQAVITWRFFYALLPWCFLSSLPTPSDGTPAFSQATLVFSFIFLKLSDLCIPIFSVYLAASTYTVPLPHLSHPYLSWYFDSGRGKAYIMWIYANISRAAITTSRMREPHHPLDKDDTIRRKINLIFVPGDEL